ncbi:LysR family transcriptional regulator [Burkholderia sp. Bp9031]|uniref:LysR family transcriptional regulator n=1 Tax=Burkholderia sp. Bp9031 TaxID=2184566 RepID=UPI0007164E07|nr:MULTISPECIES: LysR family transcriptional regulator [Burkholderia]RQZ11053.1 LysR family transcriptional regulator [Burkholderia sp. Bp9031]
MRIDPYSLELFISVVQEGSIARAASRNHIAPSALSRRIADLEAAMGVPLLIRSPSGVELTEAGRHAFSRAVSVHDQLQSLAREVQSLSGQVAGVVRLHANASAIVGFLPERLKAFQARYPLVQIALTEKISDEVVRACVDDRADVGISACAKMPGGLESWHFADDPLMVVLPLDHELAAFPAPTFGDVLRFPLVALQAGGSLDQTLKERADAMRMPLNLSVTVNSFDAQCRMVEAGLGIGIVPTSAASAFAGSKGFVRRPLDEPWARERALHVHALRKSSRLKAVQALIDALAGA